MAEKAKSTTAKKTEKYNDQSIVMLKGADRVRLRPSVIFGSDGLEGCEHAFFEILSNSVDEAREGYGSEIKVTVFEDHSIEVDDHGRGIPLDFNEKEGRYNWDLIFCEPYAGGKMNNNAESASYEYSLGLNGLGAFATQCASKYMEVDSFDGKYVRFMSFRLGSPVGELGVRELSKGERRTGTVIRWLPDRDVFTDVNIPKEFFVDVLRRQAVVNAGVKFIFLFEENGEFTEQVFYNENGIRDYVAEVAGTSALTQPVFWHLETQGRDREDKPVYRFKADISFCVSQTVTMLEYYHNASFLEHGGSPDRAVRVAFVYAIDKYLKSAGKYNKNESKITFADIADCLVLVISSNSTITSYENQTKKAITNAFIYEALTDFIKKNLEIYFTENPTEADKIAAQVLVNKRSRENAERTRLDIKKKLTGSLDVANRVEKFVNCRSKDPAVRELYIVEGDSALTSCKLGRAAEFQAIIPVRGKTLNCLKSTYDKIFKNDIIVDLLKVIGCGAEVGTRAKGKGSEVSAFSLESLRWSKIIICTDADEDGFQIRTLLLTLFYRLLPTLLKEGKVFIAETPLFEITTKDRTLFAFDEFEKAEILKKLGNQKYTLQRSKGLGENEPEMMWETTMNPDNRVIVQITIEDAEKADEAFTILMGDQVEPRRRFIEANAQYAKLDV